MGVWACCASYSVSIQNRKTNVYDIFHEMRFQIMKSEWLRVLDLVNELWKMEIKTLQTLKYEESWAKIEIQEFLLWFQSVDTPFSHKNHSETNRIIKPTDNQSISSVCYIKDYCMWSVHQSIFEAGRMREREMKWFIALEMPISIFPFQCLHIEFEKFNSIVDQRERKNERSQDR